jgi:hypothetical protein
LLHITIQTPWQIEGLPEALTKYRVKPGGQSSNFLKNIEGWEQLIERTRSYAPELILEWENKSRAYQFRYLARTAVRMQADKAIAVELIHRALSTYWRILLEEPRPTLLTWIAAYLLWLLPRALYCQTQTLASKIMGILQRRHLLQDQSGQSI